LRQKTDGRDACVAAAGIRTIVENELGEPATDRAVTRS
jgi:hypothetical protein